MIMSRITCAMASIWSPPISRSIRRVWCRRAASAETGTFCHGDMPGLADICLAAQVTSNARFGLDMTPYPTIARINAACMALSAFQKAAPQNQIDAE